MAATGAGAEAATAPDISRRIQPDTALSGAFEDAYARYKEAGAAIRRLSLST